MEIHIQLTLLNRKKCIVKQFEKYFFHALQKCWRKSKMHPKRKYLELNATANSSIVGRCVIVLNGWGWKKPAEMWKVTTVVVVVANKKTLSHTVHGSSFRERIVAGLKQVFEHVLCVDSNCFEQHMNPSCILRHNKKNCKHTSLSVCKKYDGNGENSRKPSIIYYTGAYTGLIHGGGIFQCLLLVVSVWRERFISVSAWVCVQKHLTLPLITSEKRANSKLFQLFTWYYSSTNIHLMKCSK